MNFMQIYQKPQQGCFLAMRDIVLNSHPELKASWKWSSPFFSFRGNMFCYFWKDKKTGEPYIGFHRSKEVEHPKLEMRNRKLLKTYHINPHKDLPIEEMKEVIGLILEQHLLQ